MLRDKYNEILRDYEMNHPHFYEQTIDWWPAGRMSIFVELKNGNRYEFNRYDSTLRRLRDKNEPVTEEILTKEIGINLRKHMPFIGKTQQELCNEIGVANTMLSRYIHGKASPSAAKLFKIAKAMGCTLDELFDETYME